MYVTLICYKKYALFLISEFFNFLKMCKTIEGFQYLALSEPNPQKKFHRLGWIVFKEGTDMDVAYEKLNEKKVYCIILFKGFGFFMKNYRNIFLLRFFHYNSNRLTSLSFILPVIKTRLVPFVIELPLM